MESNKYFCIFGGGAIRGLVYIGAVKAMRERNIQISGFAGASAGSLAAVMAALNYSYEEMYEIFNRFDYMMFRDINLSFKIELAISKGEVFTDKIREIISSKIKTDKPVTFKDFPADLYILTSNLTTGKSVIFSKETTPDFEVAQAVRISTGFPVLMNPVEIKGECYIDGDLARACALSQISPLLNPKNERILEFRIEGSRIQKPPTNPLNFFNNGLDFVTNIATENVLKTFENRDKYDFIVFKTKDILLFDFSISKEQKEYLINLGYETTAKFFDENLPPKRQMLKKKYSLMEETVKKCYNNIISYSYEKAKSDLNLYFSENYKDFELFDENITDLFEDTLKLLNNGISKSFLGFKTVKNLPKIKENLKKLSFLLAKITK